MVNLDKPFTYENSCNPWIMETADKKNVIEIDGNKITASYLWSLNENDRIKCLNKVFDYYRAKGFPHEVYDFDYIVNQIEKLRKYDESKVINSEGYISNSGSLCLDVCRSICSNLFWKAKSENMRSIEDAFNDDAILIKVLKNRMGWNTTKEDGYERPYMFSISDSMIRTGIRNSGYGYGVSNFRPTIAKFFYKRYLGDTGRILDYSAGWGARMLAAAVCGYDYVGIDPLTSDCLVNANVWYGLEKYGSKLECYKIGSEEDTVRAFVKEDSVDLCFSCPPYFKLEVYSEEESQSYNKFNEFSVWIEKYWRPTVKNCKYALKNNGKFVLIIKDNYNKYDLKNEMERVLVEEGFSFVESFQYKTSTNHLSSKIKTGRVSKNNEYVLTYECDK